MKNNMHVRLVMASVISLALITGCQHAPPHENGRTIPINNIVDLTHTLSADFPFIPVKELTYPFELIPMATLKKNGVEANTWRINELL